jgi:SAM-dependent methyltransferase
MRTSMTDPGYSTALDRVVERWQDRAFTADLSQIHWMASPVVCQYLNRRASGSPDCDWLTSMFSRYIHDRGHRVLVLGCGDGWLERAIARHWWIERIDAFDVATGAVERAAAEAKRLGLEKIRYGVRDLNVEPVPGGPYELIIAHSVIHHIENLEFFFEGLRGALADDGILLVNEYVGPKRFQFTERQMDIINALFTALPATYRKGRVGGNVYPRKERPTVEEMIATDPSEAVRSDEILGFLARNFELLDTIDYGGSILHHLLYDVVPNFSMDRAADRAMVETLCLVEEALTVKGGLFADFQILAAAKGPLAPRSPLRPEPLGSDRPAPADRWEPLARIARRIRPSRPLNGPPVVASRPAREELSRQLTGDTQADWIQWVLASAGRDDLSVMVAGDGGDELAARLESDPLVRRVTCGRPGRSSVRHDIVFGWNVEWNDASAAALASVVSPGGTIAFVSRVGAGRAPEWLVGLANRLVELAPPAWRRASGFRGRLRHALALGPGDAPNLAAITGTLARFAGSVEVHPLASQLTELLLAACAFPAKPADEAEEGLARLLVAADLQLVAARVVEPTVALVVARGCSAR